jgi:hypothetical protein
MRPLFMQRAAEWVLECEDVSKQQAAWVAAAEKRRQQEIKDAAAEKLARKALLARSAVAAQASAAAWDLPAWDALLSAESAAQAATPALCILSGPSAKLPRNHGRAPIAKELHKRGSKPSA